MNILGLNSFHGDASACIVRDGRLVAAAEEERFRRVKHGPAFRPRRSNTVWRRWAWIDDVDSVVLNQDSMAGTGAKLAYLMKARPKFFLWRSSARTTAAPGKARRALLRELFPA